MFTTLLASFSVGGLIPLLVWLLVLAIVCYVVFLVIGLFGLPEPIRRIVTLIVGLVFLLMLLQKLAII